MISIPPTTRIGDLTPQMVSQVNEGLSGERYGKLTRCEQNGSWHYTTPGGLIHTLCPDAIVDAVWELARALNCATAPGTAAKMKVEKQSYVAGFMFDRELTCVALIRKLKPVWQCGDLNGIGGKVEPGEFAFVAMVREFAEETGVQTTAQQWSQFVEMGGTNDDGGKFRVDFFAAIGDVTQLRSMEEEQVEIVQLKDVYPKREDMIDNLPWLVALAVDHLQDGRPSFVMAEYNRAYLEPFMPPKAGSRVIEHGRDPKP